MKTFFIKTQKGQKIKFQLYMDDAPITSKAFLQTLPFKRTFYQARTSGQEIWIDNAPELDIIQENASVFPKPGEIIIGPKKPLRNAVAGCMGIFYGEGKGLDCSNIFGKVFAEDMELLVTLGNEIWKQGEQELIFEK